jgi:hypothetical protein
MHAGYHIGVCYKLKAMTFSTIHIPLNFFLPIVPLPPHGHPQGPAFRMARSTPTQGVP